MVPVELRVRARADRERAQQQVERLADRVRVRERAEVAHALAVLAAHHHRPRPLLVERDREVRVRLVVLEPDVEARLVPLDEVELEEERLDLVLGDDPLDVVGRLHHLVGALGQRRGRREVVRQPAAQALGLPDVDDPALGVEELVRAGRVGDAAGLRAGDHAPIVADRVRRTGRSPRCYRWRHAGPVSGAEIPGSEADNPAVWRPGCHPPANEQPLPRNGEAQHAASPGSAAGRLHPRDPRRARRAHRGGQGRRSATGS